MGEEHLSFQEAWVARADRDMGHAL